MNSFVYVKVYVKEGWTNKETGKKGDPRLQFNNFQQLQDVMGSQARKLTLQINIKDLTEDTVTTLKDLVVSHKGDHQISVVVYEMKEQIKLTMQSRKQKVNISNELLDALDQQFIHYKLN